MPTLAVGMLKTRKDYHMPTTSVGMAPVPHRHSPFHVSKVVRRLPAEGRPGPVALTAFAEPCRPDVSRVAGGIRAGDDPEVGRSALELSRGGRVVS